MLMQERLEEYGQDNLIAAEKTQGIGSVEKAAIQRLEELSANGLEKLMKEKQLDAIVTPDTTASAFSPSPATPPSLCLRGTPRRGSPSAYASADCRGTSQG
ncbi:hypothetical protein ACQ4PT_012392 [Festuca glaucescens]